MIRYYTNLSDDFVKTKNQAKSVPDNYIWIEKNPAFIFLGAILFQILKIVGFVYGKIAFRLQIVGKNKLRAYRRSVRSRNNSQKFAKLGASSLTSAGGFYIYANHVLSLGDVFHPALYCPVHPYYICDSSNLGIPILGPILPLVGALPIPDSIRGKKQLFDAISTRAKQGKAIVVYPEAHLWPYYTGIRPFENTAFNFPVRDDLPVFTATTVFNKKKRGKRPRATIYIDGPFTPTPVSPEKELTKKEKIQSLHDQVYSALKKRSRLSDYKYITYKQKPESASQDSSTGPEQPNGGPQSSSGGSKKPDDGPQQSSSGNSKKPNGGSQQSSSGNSKKTNGGP